MTRFAPPEARPAIDFASAHYGATEIAMVTAYVQETIPAATRQQVTNALQKLCWSYEVDWVIGLEVLEFVTDKPWMLADLETA